MNNLLIADLHLTDNPIDEYRWKIFDWIKDLRKRYLINNLYILGDLTDKKDNHSSLLVNKLTDNICDLAEVMSIVILKGNHDAINLSNPFFKFFNEFPVVKFISLPCIINQGLFIPYTKNFKSVEKTIEIFDSEINHSEISYIYTHLPLIGSVAQNGWELKEGVDISVFSKYKNIQVFAGDIHTPQKIGNVEYVGSPYNTTFSDSFKGQAILLNESSGSKVYLKPGFLRRYSLKITNPKELLPNKFKANDQVKIRVELGKEELYLWDEYRREIKEFCNATSIELVSLDMVLKQVNIDKTKEIGTPKKETPIEIVERFSRREKLDEDFITIAKELLC